MEIFDAGTYETHEWTDRKVEVTLYGERIAGRYGLFRATRRRERAVDDPPSRPAVGPAAHAAAAAHAADARARGGRIRTLPRDDDRWGYEVKWDGVRALLWSDHGHVRIESRTQREITKRYPELRALGRALGAHELLLDGELVAFDEHGRPSFERLQSRMNVEGEAAIRRAARAQPVVYMAFDLLHLDGRSLLELPYEQRRALLERLGLEGPAWRTPRFHRGGGEALLDATRAQGLEGIVAKRLDARYEPGRRSGAGASCRNRRRQELVIGGWTAGEGRRVGRVGALLLGVHERTGGPLRYAGRVGSGFSEAMLDELERRLEPLRRTRSPFRADPARPGARPPRGAHFVAPQLVAEVELTDLTSEGLVRQGVFKGLRDDKAATDVVPEHDGARGTATDRSRPHSTAVSCASPTRQAAVPTDRLHEGGPDRLLRADRADAAAAPARPATHRAPLAGRCRGQNLLREERSEAPA